MTAPTAMPTHFDRRLTALALRERADTAPQVDLAIRRLDRILRKLSTPRTFQ